MVTLTDPNLGEKMKSFRILIIVSLLKAGIFFGTPIYADKNTLSLDNLWENIKSEGTTLIDRSVEFTTDLSKKINETLDAELNSLKEYQNSASNINVRDKIDMIRIHVDQISDYKKKELNASSFTLISKSKKDFRIKIDEVLSEIEPVLFDGEIVNYASKIRNVRIEITQLKEQKATLNEDMIFAPEKGTLLKSSKMDIRNQINQVDELISKSVTLISELEYDLKKKMSSLGIELTREQIRVITTRVDGDELTRSFAIFDITKQISNSLSVMVKENSFNADTTVKYYGTYVILSEILGYSQREYINKIESVYLPAIDQIEDQIEETIKFAESSLEDIVSSNNRDILKSNIRSNQFSLKVVKSYRNILTGQIANLEGALLRTDEQILVAYSTYDTAANSANLVNLINETQNTFDRIMDMQVPDIVPFENTELELKFQEISAQIINSSAI